MWCGGMEESLLASTAHRLSIEERKPRLVRVPADSRRVSFLCLSCYLCLSFASSSQGGWKCSCPPREPGHPRTLPRQAGNAGASPAAAAAFPGRAGMCSQGSRPELPPSFFIHENSISQAAGQPEASCEPRGAGPPAPKSCPHTSGPQPAAPGQLLTSGLLSAGACTPTRIPLGRPYLAPADTPHRCLSTPKAQISHPPKVTCFHHCLAGPKSPGITAQADTPDPGEGAQAWTPLVLPASPHPPSPQHKRCSQPCLANPAQSTPSTLLPSPSKSTKGEEAV